MKFESWWERRSFEIEDCRETDGEWVDEVEDVAIGTAADRSYRCTDEGVAESDTTTTRRDRQREDSL